MPVTCTSCATSRCPSTTGPSTWSWPRPATTPSTSRCAWASPPCSSPTCTPPWTTRRRGPARRRRRLGAQRPHAHGRRCRCGCRRGAVPRRADRGGGPARRSGQRGVDAADLIAGLADRGNRSASRTGPRTADKRWPPSSDGYPAARPARERLLPRVRSNALLTDVVRRVFADESELGWRARVLRRPPPRRSRPRPPSGGQVRSPRGPPPPSRSGRRRRPSAAPDARFCPCWWPPSRTSPSSAATASSSTSSPLPRTRGARPSYDRYVARRLVWVHRGSTCAPRARRARRHRARARCPDAGRHAAGHGPRPRADVAVVNGASAGY